MCEDSGHWRGEKTNTDGAVDAAGECECGGGGGVGPGGAAACGRRMSSASGHHGPCFDMVRRPCTVSSSQGIMSGRGAKADLYKAIAGTSQCMLEEDSTVGEGKHKCVVFALDEASFPPLLSSTSSSTCM